MAMNKTPEGLREIDAKLFKAEREVDRLREKRREIINYLKLNKAAIEEQA